MTEYERTFSNLSRMCQKSRERIGGCFNCPFHTFREGIGRPSMHCIAILSEYPDETAQIVQEWVTENPPKEERL